MICAASQLLTLIYFEFLATLITESALVKSRDMFYLYGNHHGVCINQKSIMVANIATNRESVPGPKSVDG